MSSIIAGIEPTTAIKPMRNRFYLVAGLVGAVVTMVSAGVLSLFLAVPDSLGGWIAIIIGTLVAGYIVRAKTAKRWAISFGVVLLTSLLTSLALITLAVSMMPAA